eukprot:CAMPEP_0195033448 /NCGR_PEP_ID=MMETSP0326_2-20130528/65603_1 /TAXON_ID=2866 ORGANISM="Crypthecodinium cohnii, Strain Seligo" /NCGR_SAMPLE_ID=MMETSP0326_2 /ASSEMBLY_ACC=CAM_ASM_000348 /LENGTH=43 /DNA_ID= /DNA_START= /DNA_END= /DNA_ORIENTATION=
MTSLKMTSSMYAPKSFVAENFRVDVGPERHLEHAPSEASPNPS